MSTPKFSKKLRKALNTAAFNSSENSFEKALLTLSREELKEAFPNNLYLHIQKVAFLKNAQTFKELLSKFKDDEKAIDSIVCGFEEHEVYVQKQGPRKFGHFMYNHLQQKRTLLQNFVIETTTGKKIITQEPETKKKSFLRKLWP